MDIAVEGEPVLDGSDGASGIGECAMRGAASTSERPGYFGRLSPAGETACGVMHWSIREPVGCLSRLRASLAVLLACSNQVRDRLLTHRELH